MSVKHSGKNDFIEVYKNQTRFRKSSLENNYRLFVTIGKNSFAEVSKNLASYKSEIDFVGILK